MYWVLLKKKQNQKKKNFTKGEEGVAISPSVLDDINLILFYFILLYFISAVSPPGSTKRAGKDITDEMLERPKSTRTKQKPQFFHDEIFSLIHHQEGN